MSGIIIDLQKEALDSRSDVLALLRKAYFVARKLNLTDFEGWINNELNGYQVQNEIPNYRLVYGEIKALNPYSGWIPVIIPDNEVSNMINTRKVGDSISKIQSFLPAESNFVTLPYSAEQNALIGEVFDFDTKYALFVDKYNLFDIVEKVKNLILDWSITLEENGIVGEGLRFTEEEKNIAKTNTTINNYINMFQGTVSHSQIQQGSREAKQNIVNKLY